MKQVTRIDRFVFQNRAHFIYKTKYYLGSFAKLHQLVDEFIELLEKHNINVSHKDICFGLSCETGRQGCLSIYTPHHGKNIFEQCESI